MVKRRVGDIIIEEKGETKIFLEKNFFVQIIFPLFVNFGVRIIIGNIEEE